ncbi:hypothetical protein GCM10009827_115490 [Dactylosporangium maewongense]|uniref:Uncharacterized protein n=1 Tax=Dactylosporangium maewongense TaxID=634393 RepID=A0ABP4P6A8_9ACTN
MTRPALVTTESGWAALERDVRDLSEGINATGKWINNRIETYRDARDEAEKRQDKQPDQQKDTAMNEEELREQRDTALIEQLAAEDRELAEEYAARERDRAAELET